MSTKHTTRERRSLRVCAWRAMRVRGACAWCVVHSDANREAGRQARAGKNNSLRGRVRGRVACACALAPASAGGGKRV